MSAIQQESLTARKRLGRVMFRIRREQGWKQKELAARMDIHPDTLRRFEKGLQMPKPIDFQKFFEILTISDANADELAQLHLAACGIGIVASGYTQGLTQGQGAREVFESLYPILYASIAPISGAYDRQSEKCAALADAYAGLSNKRVLDAGCGFGSTSLAISAYGAGEIVAVDRSKSMLDLLRQVLLSHNDLSIWLETKGAHSVLGEFYYPTVQYLRWMRATFQGSVFYQHGTLHPLLYNILKLQDLSLGRFEVIIGNNFIHWPVNERMNEIKQADPQLTEEQVLARACHDALWPLASLLSPGGLAVFMDSKSFITLDNNWELDAKLEQKTITEHPVYKAFHKGLQRIFKQEFGIDYALPRKTELFRRTQLDALMELGGFRLKHFHHVDVTHAGDPLAFCTANFPLLLGNIPLEFDKKLAIGRRVQAELAARLPDGISNTPIREQQFFLVLERL